METKDKKIYYVIKLKSGYIEYVEHYEKGVTQYGTTTDLVDAKIYSCDKNCRKNQIIRLKTVARNVGYQPKVVEIKL